MRTRFSVVRPLTNRPHLMEPLRHQRLLLRPNRDWSDIESPWSVTGRHVVCLPGIRGNATDTATPGVLRAPSTRARAPDLPPPEYRNVPYGDRTEVAVVDGSPSPTIRRQAVRPCAARRANKWCTSTKVPASIADFGSRRSVQRGYVVGPLPPVRRRTTEARRGTTLRSALRPVRRAARRSVGRARPGPLSGRRAGRSRPIRAARACRRR